MLQSGLQTMPLFSKLKGKSGFTTSWAQMKDYTMPTSHTKFLVSRLNITPEIKRRTWLNLHVAQPPSYTLKRSRDRAADLLCDVIARFRGSASYSNFKTSKRISDHRKSEQYLAL